MSRQEIAAFYDEPTGSLTYVVSDALTRDAVVIDPVLGFDPVTRDLTSTPWQRVNHFLRESQLRLHAILETHAHADHLTAGRELRAEWPGALWMMSDKIADVFATFKKVYAWPSGATIESLGVDRWLRDGERFRAGSLEIEVIATPGHTEACLTFAIGNSLFTGDAMMMPDSGVGRCDFPGGSADTLYSSVTGKIFSRPENTRIFVGHDYHAGGRELAYETSVGEQKRANVHLSAATARQEFVAARTARDKTLNPPRLLEPSLDWNLGAHQLLKR
ncbi:MAG: MBL fold metallo-hydrolase [Bdellovibrionales bacterium]